MYMCVCLYTLTIYVRMLLLRPINKVFIHAYFIHISKSVSNYNLKHLLSLTNLEFGSSNYSFQA